MSENIAYVKLAADTPEIRDSIVITCLLSNIHPKTLCAAVGIEPELVEIQQSTGVSMLPEWFNACVERAIKILEQNKRD